jgi:Tfp pilus assembly protein PilN
MNLADVIEKIALNILHLYTPAIGIFRSPKRITIVESKGKGKHYRIIKSGQYDYNNFDIWEQITKDFSFKNKLVVTNLFNTTGLFKLVEIPKTEQSDIESWLHENSNELFAVNNILDQSILAWRIIDDKKENIIVLVAIINKNEMDEIITIFTENRITVSNIIFREISFLITAAGNEILIQYINNIENDALLITNSHGLVYYNQLPVNKNNVTKESFLTYLQLDEHEGYILESFLEEYENSSFTKVLISDFNDLEQAELLTRSARIPSGQTFNFLTHNARIRRDEIIWSNLLKGFALYFGILLSGIMLLTIMGGLIFSKMTANVEVDLSGLRPQLIEVDSLTQEKERLIKIYNETQELNENRSKTFLILEGLAVHITSPVWLTEIQYNKEDEEFNTHLIGYSEQVDAINYFLQAIEDDKNFKNVKLDYLKKLSASNFNKLWKIKSSKFTEFKILFNH